MKRFFILSKAYFNAFLSLPHLWSRIEPGSKPCSTGSTKRVLLAQRSHLTNQPCKNNPCRDFYGDSNNKPKITRMGEVKK